MLTYYYIKKEKFVKGKIFFNMLIMYKKASQSLTIINILTFQKKYVKIIVYEF